MTWVLFFLCAVTLVTVYDIEKKVNRLYRNLGNVGFEIEDDAKGQAPSIEPLTGKKVRIVLNGDAELMNIDCFTAGSGVVGEIVDHDDTWVAFRYTARKYEKVPAGSGAEDPFKLEPVKGATVTQYLRIADIESIDEVNDEN